MTLALTPPLTSFRTAEAIARSKVNSTMNVKIGDSGSGVEISRDGASVRVTPKQADIKLQPGDPIDVLLAVGADGAVPIEFVSLGQNLTYYPSRAAANATLEWAATGSGLRRIKIKFPPGAKEAFLSARDGKVDVVAQLVVPNKQPVPLGRSSCVFEKQPCQIGFQNLSGLPTDVAAAIKSGDFKLEVKLVGEDVPDLRPTELPGK